MAGQLLDDQRAASDRVVVIHYRAPCPMAESTAAHEHAQAPSVLSAQPSTSAEIGEEGARCNRQLLNHFANPAFEATALPST